MQVEVFHLLVRMVEWDFGLVTVLLVTIADGALVVSEREISDSYAMQVRMGMTEEMHGWLTRK